MTTITRTRKTDAAAASAPSPTTDRHPAQDPASGQRLKSALPFVLGWFVLPTVAMIVISIVMRTG